MICGPIWAHCYIHSGSLSDHVGNQNHLTSPFWKKKKITEQLSSPSLEGRKKLFEFFLSMFGYIQFIRSSLGEFLLAVVHYLFRLSFHCESHCMLCIDWTFTQYVFTLPLIGVSFQLRRTVTSLRREKLSRPPCCGPSLSRDASTKAWSSKRGVHRYFQE